MDTRDDDRNGPDDLPALPKLERRAGALLSADQREIAERAVRHADEGLGQGASAIAAPGDPGHCSHGSHGSHGSW